MPTTSFIDPASLIHAMNTGLGSWRPGQPIPIGATQFLDQLFSNGGRLVINELILREIVAGSHKDGGQLENWVRERIGSGQIELDPLTQAQLDLYSNLPNGASGH